MSTFTVAGNVMPDKFSQKWAAFATPLNHAVKQMEQDHSAWEFDMEKFRKDPYSVSMDSVSIQDKLLNSEHHEVTAQEVSFDNKHER